MSYFGNDEKDEIVEAIIMFAKARSKKNENNREIIYNVMEAVTEGINEIILINE